MSELFAQAAESMLAGMGVVFVFIIVLTGAGALLTQLCPVDAAATPTTFRSASDSLPIVRRGWFAS